MNIVKRRSHAYPVSSIWDDFFGKNWLDLAKPAFSDHSLPAVNIKESDVDFSLELAVPGMSKDDFKIEVENDRMSVSAEHEANKKEEDEKYTRQEFSFQSFKRSFQLPKSANADKIKANYAEGLLKITIPKREEAKLKPSRFIEVG